MDDKEEELSTAIGIVSIAAIVHSHLCWFYSIIYIAYHKITPTEQQKQIKWKAYKRNAPVRPTITIHAHSSPLIKSQHKLSYERYTSDMPIITEVHTHLVSREDSHSSSETVVADSDRRRSLDGKRRKALGFIIRSRFHRTQSTGDLETLVCSDDCLDKKMRKRDTILGITRKFSDKLVEQQKRLDNKIQPTRTRLFHSLSSLKREK
ncbi:hypothetical protein EDC96DRAFT_531400 [Choanephora cucurbitarum]|nr:hypothetical protein EDC96DRAFT_531400 [Choanephora cucurbitarum]